MRPWKGSLVLAAISTITGCPVTSIPPSQPSFQPLSQPVVESVVGTFTHARTPPRLLGRSFLTPRAQIVRYDSAGLDVGVGYNLVEATCGAAVTIYVSPGPQHAYVMADPAVVESTQASYLRRYFEASKAEIPKHHEGARPLAEGPEVLRNPLDRSGLKSIFTYTDVFAFVRQPVQSELHVFIMDRAWFVKYRATYPESCASHASQRVLGLMSAFAWPG
jgi:hypothetical protein